MHLFFLLPFHHQMDFHAIGSRCPTTDLTIHNDAGSTHVARMVNASIRDATKDFERVEGNISTARRTSGERERGQTSNTNGSRFATSPILRMACGLAQTEEHRFSGSTRGRTDLWSHPLQRKRLVRVNGGRRSERCEKIVLAWTSIRAGERQKQDTRKKTLIPFNAYNPR